MDNYSILNDLASMKSQPSRIMAMGIGGAGCNAVEHMWQMAIEGVNLAACNTDQDDLDKLHIRDENKILLGGDGLGAGNIAAQGELLARASLDKVRGLLTARGTKMLFLAAGMGAGTGTGATPVIAELAHEMDILTVAIVTTPPSNEGPDRTEQSKEGIKKLRKHVDAIIVLSNDAISQLYGHLPAATGFGRANDVVAFAAKGIAEIITHKSNLVNVDFSDVCTVMRNSGSAIMGVATETGEDRADKVIDKILTSPLFGNVSISGSRNVLINISVSSADGLTLNEAHRVRDRVQHHAKFEDEDGNIKLTNIIWGMSIKPNLAEDEIEVVVVATGFPNDPFIRTIKADDDIVEPKSEPKTGDGIEEVPTTSEESPRPYRSEPSPIMRPSRNFVEYDDCKRVPAYIAHKITLTTATKTHQVAGMTGEEPAENTDMPALF
jgi:cell division protein FtsZ